MRIIIVEDEPNIRDGIVHIIKNNTSHEIVAALETAEAALDVILREPPDLIITDIRMGDMDGLTMIKKLREASVESTIVVLTGFSSFDYAREAIHLNVMEYLLKPITVEDLLNCLHKVEQEGKRKHHSESLEQLFMMQLSGNLQDSQRLQQEIQQTYGVSGCGEYLLVLFQLKSMDRQSYYWSLHKIQEKLSMLCIDTAFVLKLFSEQKILLLIFQSERNPYLESTLEQYILSAILEEVCCMCVAYRFSDLQALQKQVDFCSSKFIFSLLIPQETMITSQQLEHFPCHNTPDVDELEQKCKQAIVTQNCEQILSIAEEYARCIFSKEFHPQSILDTTIRFLCNICICAEEKNPELKGFFNYNTFLSEILQITTLEELRFYFHEIMEQIAQSRAQSNQESNNLVVSRVIRYVQQHYMEDISLSVLAEQLCLTPEYLSGLFTKEMGINFSSFIKHFRISHARRLLGENKLKISEIANQVGFRDPKYFNRVFKEINAISPSEYRASLYR